MAPGHGWSLQASPYVLAEVANNLDAFPAQAMDIWADLRQSLQISPDILTVEFPVVFSPAKDRPVLFTAMAWADVLLTLDRRDFGGLIGTGFYSLAVLTPGMFLRQYRETL